MAHLTVLRRARTERSLTTGQNIPLTHTTTFIGRHSDCHIIPEQAAVSRFHCIVTRVQIGALLSGDWFADHLEKFLKTVPTGESDLYLLIDCGSKNGTSVNDIRVKLAVLLSNGDEITVTDYVFRFSTGDEMRMSENEQPEESRRPSHGESIQMGNDDTVASR